ncbi:hypothetical protein INR49_027305 [Caranx melampygus]|nr:hypothetical protein INR49_027305 [Caranx melampygus]
MSIDSKVEKKIKVAAGTKANLSFLDCPYEDMRLTASAVLIVKMWEVLFESPHRATLDSCLRMPLHNYTWHINIPQDGTVDLVSPTGSFQQSIPGQECNQSVHANVSVTATAQNFNKTRGLYSTSASVRRSQDVVSNPAGHTQLAGGMRPSSTVSWVVAVPSYYQAQVEFVNFSQPKCLERHTAIIVKMLLGHEEELMSRREGGRGGRGLAGHKEFLSQHVQLYPEERHLIFQPSSLDVGVLVFLLIVLAVVCCIIRKKKKNERHGVLHLYWKRKFFRRLWQQHPDHYPGIQVDSYKTFTGPTDGQLPVIKEPDPERRWTSTRRPRPLRDIHPIPSTQPIDRQDSLGFQDRRMVDNELYTFKSTGDINTIRLSGADMELQPPT